MSGTLARERALELIAVIAGLGDAAAAALSPSTGLAEIGFDSLAFAELAAEVERITGVDLDPASIDERSTVGDVLRAIATRPPEARRRARRSLGRLQAASNAFGGWAFRWWFDLRVEGTGHVPATGPAILAMNHESALDIPIAVVACPRPVTFMAKEELFKNAFVSWWLHELGGFRVDRERFDLGAVRHALETLARGEVLGMYPEGTRAPGELLPFLHGAAWLAARTGAAVVPCAISGTDAPSTRPRASRVRVVFAPPVVVDRVEDPRERRRRALEVTAAVRSAVASRLGRGTS